MGSALTNPRSTHRHVPSGIPSHETEPSHSFTPSHATFPDPHVFQGLSDQLSKFSSTTLPAARALSSAHRQVGYLRIWLLTQVYHHRASPCTSHLPQSSFRARSNAVQKREKRRVAGSEQSGERKRRTDLRNQNPERISPSFITDRPLNLDAESKHAMPDADGREQGKAKRRKEKNSRSKEIDSRIEN